MGLDVCGVHSVCNVYEVFGSVVFSGAQSVCSVYGALGLDVCGVYNVFIIYGVFGLDVCSVYEAFGLVFFCVAFRVFVALLGDWVGTLWRVQR